MVLISEPALKILVVGEPGSTKENFINKFLCHFPSSAELCRKSDTTHFLYYFGKNLKIQLHDANDVLKIERKFYDDMDLVFFCYAAVDPGSFQSVEKWIDLMTAEVEKEEVSSPPETKKEVFSFLVADSTNYGSQKNVAFSFDQMMKKLEDFCGIKRLIEISFEDEESTSSAFQIILDEIIPAKLKENSYFNELNKKCPSECQTDSNEQLPRKWPEPCSAESTDLFPCDGNLEDKNRNLEESLMLHEVSMKIRDLMKDYDLSVEEAFEELKELKSSLKERNFPCDPLELLDADLSNQSC